MVFFYEPQRPFGSSPQPISAWLVGVGAKPQRPFGSMAQPVSAQGAEAGERMHRPFGSMLQPSLVHASTRKAQARSRRALAGAAFEGLELLSDRALAAEAVQVVARATRTRRTASLRTVGIRAPLEVGSATASMTARAALGKMCTGRT